MIRWYVVQTQAQREQDAAEELGKLGFKTFAPQFMKRMDAQPRMSAWQRRHWKNVLQPRPLFPRYGFVAFDATIDRWRTIIGARNIVRLLMASEERPHPVPIGVVEEFQRMVSPDGFIHEQTQAEPWTALRGKNVRVLCGPFTDFIGLCQKSDEGRVVVLLSLFGRDQPTPMPWQNVEVVE